MNENVQTCWCMIVNGKLYHIMPLAGRNSKKWIVSNGDWQVWEPVSKEKAWMMAEQMYAEIKGWA